MDWWNLMKQSVTVSAQLLWSGRYGCNNGRYGCTIVMSHIEINKAVSQWLLTFNLCVSVTWPLTCAFHIPCTHTPEIIDMHRGVCDKRYSYPSLSLFHFIFQSNASDIMLRSILGPILPEAMVCYLENYESEKFAQIFLGEFDTPEAIWSSEMR